jgi:hypothetical protein
MTATSDLWNATDRLTQPVPYTIDRDSGHTEHLTLPHLQIDAVDDGTIPEALGHAHHLDGHRALGAVLTRVRNPHQPRAPLIVQSRDRPAQLSG